MDIAIAIFWLVIIFLGVLKLTEIGIWIGKRILRRNGGGS